ncbi:MAG: molybdopterin-guanine dinucleotide biosynthesis protein [Proteobacteria bacterium]|nr:molybdopterin-guanine dinucleotide biosynthesis protein [Pseudomonadota bacterium]
MPGPPPDTRNTTGLVLAGGQSRRMGGADKGLVEIAGRPMIEHVLDALRPQVGALLINANRNADRYAAYGVEVVPDSLDGFLGPLAGVLSALEVIDTDYLLTAPCDAPLLAPDLAPCMHAALERGQADLVVAHDGERQQPVFLLLKRRLAADLRDYLAGGGRKIDLWTARQRLAEADLSHRRDSFINVNDPEERQRVEQLLLNRLPAG